MDLCITGKTALITGGDSGIGWHTAQERLREGVTVFLTDREPERLARAADTLDVSEGRVRHHAAAVTRLEGIAALGAAVLALLGGAVCLVGWWPLGAGRARLAPHRLGPAAGREGRFRRRW